MLRTPRCLALGLALLLAGCDLLPELLMDIPTASQSAGPGMSPTGSSGPAELRRFALPRAIADRPDDVKDFTVHAVYVVPADGPDRALDTQGTLGAALEKMTGWTRGKTGGLAFRLDTVGGVPDVSFLRLKLTEAELKAAGEDGLDLVEEALLDAGFDDPRKIYAMFYEGAFLADHYGIARWQAMLFLGSGADYTLTMTHELLHTVGMVPACAPGATDDGHLDDGSNDLMSIDTTEPSGPDDTAWVEPEIDPGRNSYFRAHLPGCLDLSRSAYLDPRPLDAQLPADRPLVSEAPVGGRAFTLPDDPESDFVLSGLAVSPGPAGSGTVTLAGLATRKPHSTARYASVVVGERSSYLSFASGATRPFVASVPDTGDHAVYLTALRNTSDEDDDSKPYSVVAFEDGQPTDAADGRLRARKLLAHPRRDRQPVACGGGRLKAR